MLTGYFEAIDYFDGRGWFCKGWAFDGERPDQPVSLELWTQAGVLVRFVADLQRPDLLEAGMGSGHCAFELQLPDAVLDGEPHMLQVVAPAYRKALESSPRVFALPRFRGRMEAIKGLSIEGWAKDELDPERPVVLEMLVDGRRRGQVECSVFRADLPRSLGTCGHNAFRETMPLDLCDGQPHEVALRVANTDIVLVGTPFTVSFPAEVAPAAARQFSERIDALEAELVELRARLKQSSLRLLNDSHRYRRWLAQQEARWGDQTPVPASEDGPTFSVVAGGTLDAAALESLTRTLDRSHRGWELLAVGARSDDPRMRGLDADPNARPAEALLKARGAFVLGLPAGYRPHPALLGELDAALRDDAGDAAYVDEDSVDAAGERHSPRFKPDWDPDRFMSSDYIGDACCIRRDRLLRALGEASDPTWAGLAEATLMRLEPNRLRHIPHVLLHRAGAVEEEPAERRAARLQLILDEFGWPARAEGVTAGIVRLHWAVPEPAPGVTLVIPTRDRVELLRTCIESIVGRTRYRPYSIIVVDNGSTEPDCLGYLGEIERWQNVRVLRSPGPFNFSALNNAAVAVADTPLVALVNNDVEVIDGDWLGEMVSHALRPEVGAVGAKLLYPDGSIQHGGVVVGFGGVADNAQKGLAGDEPGYLNAAIVAQQCSAVTAACLVCRRDAYRRVGGFDAEALPVSFNDVDFCLKLRKEGLRVVWTPHAVLRHHESASRGVSWSAEAQLREEQEAERLRERWRTDSFVDPFYNPNLTRTNNTYCDFDWPGEDWQRLGTTV